MFQPVGGMDQISKGFQRAMDPKRITFNAEVQSVQQSDSGVKVAYLDTKSGKKTSRSPPTTSSSACRSTSLAKLDINVSPEMMEAMKEVNYSNSAKMGLQMKRRFWEEDDQIFGGHLYSNLPIGEFSYPSNDYFTQEGRAARPLRQRSGRQPARSAGRRAHRARADEREQGASADPHRVRERVRGVVAEGEIQRRRLRQRPQRSSAAQQLSKVDNRIVIGSAAVTPHSEPDWQEGAVSAGWQALKLVHERAMRG